ncbi:MULTISPECIES: hypothetical protein [unclassified Nitratiruptor]|uniref:hypothetical protein n=1 Tax=unclassified Nitratiruptor TaxID=2624044 RepID=UPI00191581EB|nr:MULTISPECIES: hypothetical protein [unclassified Nitratiruptor]BCD61102.1 hypothetical protein NitYY0810_C1883 [Nitratiruptor sp. YY08-10]BCD65035.1 hypothetical protein NitYY0814_C1892 [Nitratiruptor sp. YY08-14]
MKQDQGFSIFEKQILALHYNGTYITNFEFQQIAKEAGLEVDLADREKMLKTILQQAKAKNKELELIGAFTKLLNNRIKTYQDLLQQFPESKEIIGGYIQKTRSTMMLIQQRLRTNPYE